MTASLFGLSAVARYQKFAHCWAHITPIEMGPRSLRIRCGKFPRSPAVRLWVKWCGDALFQYGNGIGKKCLIMARDPIASKNLRDHCWKTFYRWLETQFFAPKSALDKVITH